MTPNVRVSLSAGSAAKPARYYACDRRTGRKTHLSRRYTSDLARRRVAEMIGDGWQDSVRWSSSPRATVVRRLAEVEAERLEQLPSNDAHLLLAMITEGGGVPMHVLAELNVDAGQLREDLLTALNVPEDLRGLYLRQRQAYEHTQQKARASTQHPDEQARPPT